MNCKLVRWQIYNSEIVYQNQKLTQKEEGIIAKWGNKEKKGNTFRDQWL
jgi:hypothetical protein